MEPENARPHPASFGLMSRQSLGRDRPKRESESDRMERSPDVATREPQQ